MPHCACSQYCVTSRRRNHYFDYDCNCCNCLKDYMAKNNIKIQKYLNYHPDGCKCKKSHQSSDPECKCCHCQDQSDWGWIGWVKSLSDLTAK